MDGRKYPSGTEMKIHASHQLKEKKIEYNTRKKNMSVSGDMEIESQLSALVSV